DADPGEHDPQRFETDAEEGGDHHEEGLDPDGGAEDAEVRPCHGGSVGARPPPAATDVRCAGNRGELWLPGNHNSPKLLVQATFGPSCGHPARPPVSGAGRPTRTMPRWPASPRRTRCP